MTGERFSNADFATGSSLTRSHESGYQWHEFMFRFGVLFIGRN